MAARTSARPAASSTCAATSFASASRSITTKRDIDRFAALAAELHAECLTAATSTRSLSTRVLLLLLLAYIFNFLDRQIVSILKIPIKAELGLTDTQLGLMGGIAFASVYSTLAIPIARYADRTGRRARVIGISAAVWSLFTALCGLVTNFWQLFAARMGVGVGEAGGVAPSYALIAQHFPPSRRARALAVFSLGIPDRLGARPVLRRLAGGDDQLADCIRHHRHRRPAGRLADRDPGSRSAAGSGGRAAGRRHAPASSKSRPSLRASRASGCCRSVPPPARPRGYGLGFWLPSYFSESLGLSLGEHRQLLRHHRADRRQRRDPAWRSDRRQARRIAALRLPADARGRLPVHRPRSMPRQCRSQALTAAWALFTLAYALSLTWLGPIVNAVQSLVDPPRRATASASFLLINNLIGIGFGTFIFGYLADLLRPAYGSEAMRFRSSTGSASTCLPHCCAGWPPGAFATTRNP